MLDIELPVEDLFDVDVLPLPIAYLKGEGMN
jgi:hypothetical protein